MSETARLGVLLLGAALGPFAGCLAGCTVSSDRPDAGSDASMVPDDAAAMDADAIDFPDPTIDPCEPERMGATIGDSCTADETCDDGCFCNGDEVCEEGTCAAGADPCADEVECTADRCLEEADRCFNDPDHTRCSDSMACNGAEICSVTEGCMPAAPLYCNDENSCTIDRCDDAVGCLFLARDLDGDGFTDDRCGGDDCDDDPRFGTEIFPGAPEDCFNRRDDDCDGDRDFVDLECVPTNDLCDSAQLIEGSGIYSGATRGLTDDFEVSCTSREGPDAVYRFALTEPMNVTATASGSNVTAVTIRDFANCASGPEIRCADGNPPSSVARSLPAGEYAIIVKTSRATAFDLDVRIEPATPDPPFDTCSSAVDITEGPATVDITTMLEDTGSSCTPPSGTYRDAYFFFDLADVQDITIHTENTSFFSYQTSLSSTCGDHASELRCWSASGVQQQSWRSLPAGRYYVTTSSSQSSGMITASVDVRPPTPIPPNDRCSGAIMLTNGSSRTDTTIDFEPDDNGCSGTNFPDAFYTFTLSTRSRVIISATDPAPPNANLYLSILDGCGGALVPGGCANGRPTATINNVFDPGTYVLMVETSPSEMTDFSLSMAVFPP